MGVCEGGESHLGAGRNLSDFHRFSPESSGGAEPSRCRCQGVKFSATSPGTFENKLRMNEAPVGFPGAGGSGGAWPGSRPRGGAEPRGRTAPARLRRGSSGPLRSGETFGVYIEKRNPSASKCPRGPKSGGKPLPAPLPAAAAVPPLPGSEFRGDPKFRAKREKSPERLWRGRFSPTPAPPLPAA